MLEWLHKMKETNSKLTRWSQAMQPSEYIVGYQSGLANANADALSRCIVSPLKVTKMPGGGSVRAPVVGCV